MEKNRKRKKELAAFLILDDAVKEAKQLRDEDRKKFEAAESVQVIYMHVYSQYACFFLSFISFSVFCYYMQGELSQALRKMEMADRLGCKALDLVEKVVPVPEEARGRLVGRGGSNIHAVEKDCDVTIDLDRKVRLSIEFTPS